MKDKYNVYVNEKPYEVPYYIMLCHATGEFKTFETQDKYSLFIRNYRISYKRLLPILNTIRSYLFNKEDDYEISRINTARYFYKDARTSLLYAGWLCSYGFTDYQSFKQLSQDIIVNKYLTYSPFTFSDSYNQIKELNIFYKGLLIDINFNLQKYEEGIRKKIYPKDIEDRLNQLGYKNISYEDIKKDIQHHMILTKYKDYYIWGSKVVIDWLLRTDFNTLSLFNLNKDLSKINFTY